MATTKKKFASQADVELLDRLKEIAREEGRHFQAVLEDSMRFYLEQRDAQTPRASVMANFRASVERNRRLGKLLAKQVRDYPTLTEVLAMHQVLLEEFGGSGGVRDMGALESALMRPQLGYYDALIDEAAALLESLAMNHPFVDCNKRVAFFVTDTFLRMNGRLIDCDNDEAYAFFMSLFDANEFRFDRLREWLTKHVRAL